MRRCTSAQDQKLKLVEVIFDLKEDSLVAATSGGSPSTVAIPEITKVGVRENSAPSLESGSVGTGPVPFLDREFAPGLRD